MLGFVIGDKDMITGFRLVGVHGTEVNSVDQARAALQESLSKRDLAVVLISEDFSNRLNGEIEKIREQRVRPIIVAIPSRNGSSGETRLSDLIRKTLGFRL